MAGDERRAVWLIGLGNIGLRHLQGLEPLAAGIRLYGADMDALAVERAHSEWSALPGAEGVFASTLPTEPGPPGLAILATSARPREALVLAAIEAGARALVLEKVVFDTRAAFDRVGALIRARGVITHVNCARRMWPMYSELAARCAGARSPVQIRAYGRNLSIACNGVHFLDLLQFLSGEDAVKATGHSLSAPWSAKRPGFYEVWGEAAFSTDSGATLKLSSAPDMSDTNVVEIDLDGETLTIEERVGSVVGRTLEETFGRPPYQSELTGPLATTLLYGGECPLPTLETSRLAHFALFDALEPTFQAADLARDGRLPIT